MEPGDDASERVASASDTSYKKFVKIKLCSDPTSATYDLYYVKIAFFDNGEPEEFLLFVHTFNINLVASGTLETGTKVQYIHLLFHGEELCQFESQYAYVESTNPHLWNIVLRG